MKINWLKLNLLTNKKYREYAKKISFQHNKSFKEITNQCLHDMNEYQCHYEDYFLLHFYEMPPKQKTTYLTYYQNEYLNKKYNQNFNEYILLKEEPYQKDCQELSELNSGTNIFHFLILKNEIVSANLTLSLNQGLDITAPINLDTGIIDYPGYNNDKEYEKNPDNNEEILWFKIPKWPRIKRHVIKESSKIENNKYIIINLLLTIDGPVITSYQTVPYDFYRSFEIPMALKQEEGILPIITKIERGNNNENSNCH